MSSEKISTRTKILKTTWKLLENGGGNAVRMADIAKAVKISRQALYLHFPNRADLLIATTRYLDEVHDIEEKLSASRSATSGTDRLEKWVDVWGNYIPNIYGISKALLAIKDTDKEAAAAWNDRMQAVRHGCAAAVSALKAENSLNASLTEEQATDLLWTLLSVRAWEQLRVECGWSQETYIAQMKETAARALVK
ncbi:MAG: TetR/AcrR family transcriptional regulator [Pseudomonadota bacterium]